MGKPKTLGGFPVSKKVKCLLMTNLDMDGLRRSTPKEIRKKKKIALEDRRRTIEEVVEVYLKVLKKMLNGLRR